MHTEESKMILALVAMLVGLCAIIGLFLYSQVRAAKTYTAMQESGNEARIREVEQERLSVVGEIHDDVCPMVLGIANKLSEVEANLKEHNELLTESCLQLRGLYNRMRQFSMRLIPPGLDDQGPLYAFDNFCCDYLRQAPIEIIVDPIDCKGLSLDRSLHLYRMLQEITQNAIKHSKGRLLTIDAELENNELTIFTEDDGRGFEFASNRHHSFFGLYSLAARAKAIGAELITNTAPGKGTRYQIRLKINPAL